VSTAATIDDPRLTTRLGSIALVNPIICGSGEHVMTASGIRAALRAGVAGVVAKSINESADAARQLNGADYAQLAPDGTLREWRVPGDPALLGNSLFCRSGLAGYPPGDWFSMIATLDREAAAASRFVAASIVLASDQAACDLASLAAGSEVRILELNIGAPHGAEARAGAITVHHR
jgi:dihydroorotate dehydrogenase (NAD+) catalytic subunit